MKIGILTYHRSHNYGALLQAFALRFLLQKMGNEVYFIDYWPSYHKQMYDLFSVKEMFACGVKGGIKYALKIVFSWNKRKKRIASFNRFIENYISPFCTEYSSSSNFDIIIYGSDQIWRKQDRSGRFNPIYFADNILSASQHVSYAASMGNANLDDKDYDFLRKEIKKFSEVSVREEKLKIILSKIGIQSQVVLDPTFLLSKADWDNIFPVKRMKANRYVLYYRLLKGSFDEKQIEIFCKDHGCELIILEGYPKPTLKKTISSANPLDFLSLIKYAEFVFTTDYYSIFYR